jgi:hypothetical protein
MAQPLIIDEFVVRASTAWRKRTRAVIIDLCRHAAAAIAGVCVALALLFGH